MENNKMKYAPQFSTRMSPEELLETENSINRLGVGKKKSRREYLLFINDVVKTGYLDELAGERRGVSGG